MRTISDIVHRVHAAYLEMPGPALKREQVQRLCGLERATWQVVLDSLLSSNLSVKPDGGYARLTDAYLSSPIGWGFGTQSGNPAPHVSGQGVSQSDDRPNARERQASRQPERRRYRSDTELRKARAQWERQWNERQAAPSHDAPDAPDMMS